MQSRVRSYPTVFQNAMPHKGLAAKKRNATNKKKTMKKNWVTFASNFYTRPQPPNFNPNIYKNSEIFEENAKLHKVISYFYQMYAQI